MRYCFFIILTGIFACDSPETSETRTGNSKVNDSEQNIEKEVEQTNDKEATEQKEDKTQKDLESDSKKSGNNDNDNDNGNNNHNNNNGNNGNIQISGLYAHAGKLVEAGTNSQAQHYVVNDAGHWSSLTQSAANPDEVIAKEWNNLAGTLTADSIEWANVTVWHLVARKELTGFYLNSGNIVEIERRGLMVRLVSDTGNVVLGRLEIKTINNVPALVIVVDDWNKLEGVVDQLSGQINWSNSTSWEVSGFEFSKYYTFAGKRIVIEKTGIDLEIEDHLGFRSKLTVQDNKTIIANDWASLVGTVVSGNIEWSNGNTFIAGAPNPELTGDYYVHGNNAKVLTGLQFENESGAQSVGSFLNPSSVLASDWLKIGDLDFENNIVWRGDKTWRKALDMAACLAANKPTQTPPDLTGFGCTLTATTDVGVWDQKYSATMTTVGNPDSAVLNSVPFTGTTVTQQRRIPYGGGVFGQVVKGGVTKTCSLLIVRAKDCEPLGCQIIQKTANPVYGQPMDFELKISGNPTAIYFDQQQVPLDDRRVSVIVNNINWEISGEMRRMFQASVVDATGAVSHCSESVYPIAPPPNQALSLLQVIENSHFNAYSVHSTIYQDTDIDILNTAGNVLVGWKSPAAFNFYKIFHSTFTATGTQMKACLKSNHNICSPVITSVDSSVTIHDAYIRGERLHLIFSAFTDGTIYGLYSGTTEAFPGPGWQGVSSNGRFLHASFERAKLHSWVQVGTSIRVCHGNIDQDRCKAGTRSNDFIIRAGPSDDTYVGVHNAL